MRSAVADPCLREDHRRHGHQQRAQHPCRACPGILRPLADLHADQVRAERDPDRHQRYGEQEYAALGQPGVRGSQRVNPRAHVEHGGTRKPERNTDPVDDETEEAMPAAEIVARPKIKAARAGILHRERGHRNRQRHHEQHRRQQPQSDGPGAGMCRRRNPSRAHNARDGEKSDVAQPEFALQPRRRVMHSGARSRPGVRLRCGAALRAETPDVRPARRACSLPVRAARREQSARFG